ncbi:MAG: hypothetical protein ABIR52_08250, partial [Casimicrobiaceae bacterium]
MRAFRSLLDAAILAMGFTLLASAVGAQAPATVSTVPGMPPVPDAANLYSEIGAGRLSAAVAADLPRVYVPNV